MASNFGAKRFDIDSSMQLPADGFDAELDNCFCFLNANFETDRVILEAGFIDPLDQLAPPQSLKHLEGVIDEYTIDIDPDGLTGRIRGRDLMAIALDRQFKKQFLKSQPDIEPDIDFVVGDFLASDIAQEVAASIGLEISWEARDYLLKEDFDAVGRPIDIINQLAEPFALVEPFKADVFIQGSTIFVRERKGTSFRTDYEFTAGDARILRMSIRKRQFTIFGKVNLVGELVPVNLDVQQDQAGFTVIFSGEQEETITKETFDANGNLQTRLIQITTLRMPDRIPLETLEREFSVRNGQLTLVTETRKFNEYESSRYSLGGATNQPLLETQTTEIQGTDPDDDSKTFQLIRKENKEFGYDRQRFQNIMTHRKFKRDFAAAGNPFVEDERITETLKDLDFLKVEKVVSTYKRQDDGSLPIQRQDTTVSAGVRPGGNRPGRGIGLAGTEAGDQASKQPTVSEVTISIDDRARDVRYSNRNMSKDDLLFIIDQFTRASGLIEFEITMDYVAMPWLRKGSTLLITDLFCEDRVTPIILDPALVFEQRLRFDESVESAEMVSTLRCLFWRSS